MNLLIICKHCNNEWEVTEWRVVSMGKNFKCPRCGRRVDIQITASIKDEAKQLDRTVNQ